MNLDLNQPCTQNNKTMIYSRFELKSDSMTIGFGIEGSWESEYVPSSTAMYYFMEDGVKVRIVEDVWHSGGVFDYGQCCGFVSQR